MSSPTIEELITQSTGKSFEDMTDAELIELVNSTRNCYQVLRGAAKARKAKREGKVSVDKVAANWADFDLDDEDDWNDEPKQPEINFGNLELSLGDDD